MKRASVISLTEYRKRRLEDGCPTGRDGMVPEAERLWELLDRNISIQSWKDNVE